MRVPIAYAIDDGYAKILLAQLIALYEHANPETIYDLYILNGKLTKSHREAIVGLVAELNAQAQVTFLDVSFAQQQAIPDIAPWGRETNYRGLLPEFLPHIEKILYLDADTFVLGDLSHLMHLDLEGYLFAATADYFATNRNVIELGVQENNFAIEPIVRTFGYINAGVLLMNLAYWRAHQLQAHFISLLNIIKEKKMNALPDQDVLNYLAIKDGVNRIFYLPTTYNTSYTMGTDSLADRQVDMARHGFHHRLFSEIQRNQRDSYVDRTNTLLEIDRMMILHFVSNKPWAHYRFTDRFVPLFKPYADRVGLVLAPRKRPALTPSRVWKKLKPYHKWIYLLFLFNILSVLGLSYLISLLW
ncbi:glycosyltransferase family 8 protein [Entomospira culicis]|uniref:Glycosyltransferase family 8 protein n=1 Tax=Entomospira culicis TaxID=2719989 RepID=A0A968GGY1_9SPIO|nr:glycosyltransferase family 8 protein [Entomospira culicis]NIZ19669.1 glycosyltransferase family 8 protein [Entomospira culicis]NIZ69883.1 glycosyltransferase family 8 protein [Entomospira culicis]WDI36988.1 glycosyltransferase family 8 protein [Entomospira culicis]WDI38617.1 glycosyltransferase family 8 protein [Entomospira culicis]